MTRTAFLRWIQSGAVMTMLLIGVAGCQQATYTEDNIEAAMKEICKKEYNVTDVEVKFAGTTMGVFLPLQQLFDNDIRSALLTGKGNDLETLFTPRADAMEKLEDVLFATSRVVLSTDKKIDFYQLFASDVKSTGLQFVLTGYVHDIRRLRMWDIPRSEYRKRVLHDLKLNRALLWEAPVRGFFKDIKDLPVDQLAAQYFSMEPAAQNISPLLYDSLSTLDQKKEVRIDFHDIRSRSYSENQGLVYVRYTEYFEPAPGVKMSDFLYPSGTELEYIFIVDISDGLFKISQVIPFYYVDDTKQLRKISFPRELDLYTNLESWQERFELEEIHLGDFIAAQLNRRIQQVLVEDERVRNTIDSAVIEFSYVQGSASEKPHFVLNFDIQSKSLRSKDVELKQLLADEDVLYVFNYVVREFVELVRSYTFDDFSYFELIWDNFGTSASFELAPESLELYRRKQLDISGLMKTPFGSFPS